MAVVKKQKDDSAKTEILAEFRMATPQKKVRVSYLEFSDGKSFIDLRHITLGEEGKVIIKKGISIPFEYWNVFIAAIDAISEKINETPAYADYFMDLGEDEIDYAAVEYFF
jgi:hypothetical protein